jgi:hypothetical protein
MESSRYHGFVVSGFRHGGKELGLPWIGWCSNAARKHERRVHRQRESLGYSHLVIPGFLLVTTLSEKLRRRVRSQCIQKLLAGGRVVSQGAFHHSFNSRISLLPMWTLRLSIDTLVPV